MLEKLLAAILDLTAALNNHTAALGGIKSAAPATLSKGKTKTEETPAAESSTPAASAAASIASASSAKSEEISIEDLLKTGQQILDKGGLEKIKAINAKLGLKKISQCPPEKLSDLKKALDDLLKEMDVA